MYEEKETYKLAVDWIMEPETLWKKKIVPDETYESLFLSLKDCRESIVPFPDIGRKESEPSTWSYIAKSVIALSPDTKTVDENVTKSRPPFSAPTKQLNPYFLPWIMATVLNDADIMANPDLKSDLDDLMAHFVHWDPSSKILKELRHILEPIRSKL